MRRFSARDQRNILLVGALSLLILWVYSSYLVGPLWRHTSQLSEQVRSARDRLRALEAATANAPTVEAQYRQADDAVTAMQRRLPSKEELPAVIERLSVLANEADMRIQSIFPNRTAAEGLGEGPPSQTVVYQTVPIQVEALAGYHQLGTFLSLVESGSRPMRIASLRIVSQPKESKRHLINLVIEAYLARDDKAASVDPKLRVAWRR